LTGVEVSLAMESNANPDVDKLITFGQMALEQGWYDQAREYFEQALGLDASNREAMKGLARVNEILSRKAAMAVEPMEAETPTGPPLAKRLMAGVNSVFEALEEYRQKRAEEQSRKRAKAREGRAAREAQKGGAPMQLFTPRFTVVHLGGIPDMKPGKKTLIRLKRDGLEVGQRGERGHRNMPYSCIEGLDFAPQGFEQGVSLGQALLTTAVCPPLGILSPLVKRKEPMLKIEYRFNENFVACAIFGGKNAAKLYQKLLKLVAK
jgi:hypothetical protein